MDHGASRQNVHNTVRWGLNAGWFYLLSIRLLSTPVGRFMRTVHSEVCCKCTTMLCSFLFIVLFPLFQISATLNVLIFVPGTTDDDRRLLNRLAQQLAFRHHRVCTFRAVIIPEKKYLIQPRLHDVRELKLTVDLESETVERIRQIGNDRAIWNMSYDEEEERRSMPMWTAYNTACEAIMKSDLMDLLKDEVYDVAVVYDGDPCYLAIVHALAIPYIYFDTRGFGDQVLVSSQSPWLSDTDYSVSITSLDPSYFFNRLKKLSQFLMEYGLMAGWKMTQQISQRWSILDGPVSALFQENNELKKRFSSLPDVNDIKRTASAYFINSDQALEPYGRAIAPNVVYVGGLHLEYPRPLFQPYNETNAAAKDGVIIFSLGNLVNSSLMPVEMKRAYLEAFARFPTHRIYWKIGSSTLADVDDNEIPENINFTQYIPQNDLLAADECVLLISNGGANSVMEALNYGAPVLGVPLCSREYENLKKLESKGAAIVLHKHALTSGAIYDAMRRLLEEKKYQRASRKLSRMYRDRPDSALDTAIHWVQYVGRHHGARRHTLQGPQRLAFHQHSSLDTIAVFIACMIVVGQAGRVMLKVVEKWRRLE